MYIPFPSAKSAQLWSPHKMLTEAPNGNLEKKLCYATSRGRMDFLVLGL